jgi:hypothetical protein
MPEIINNVTTGTGLLHEVFQETIKQAFVSAGFPRYEYDTTTGKYKNVVDGTDLEYDVRFPKVFEINDDAMDYKPICMTMVGDWLDYNLIPLSDGIYSSVSSYIRTHHRIFKIDSSGNVLNSSYAYNDLPYSSSRLFEQRQFIYLNPETGYFVTVGLGYFDASNTSSYRVRIPVALLSYDYIANSISFPSRVAVDTQDDTSNRQSFVSLISKVYKYETSTDVFYSMFLLTHELTPSNQPRRILLLVVRYSKTSKTVSAWTKRVVDNLYNDVPWSSILPATESISQWNITSNIWPHVFENSNSIIPPYGFKELVSTVSSPSSITGNLLVFASGYRERSLLMRAVKIPFTLNLDTSNPANSGVSFDYSSSSLYGPFHIMQSFHNGYMYSDLSKIEFPRRSTYTPPANYAFKVSDYANINYNRVVMVVNNDIDTDSRLSLSMFLHTGWDSVTGDRYGNPYGLYEDPRMMINNIELTPGGGVYFTGFTHISKTTLRRFFLVSKHHPDIYTISQIRDNNLSMSGFPDTRSSNFIVSFRGKIPEGVSFGSSLSSRLVQPYIVKISDPDIYSYQLDPSNSNNDKTTYSRNNSLFLTNLIWVNYYNSGYFVPVFFLAKPGGDGIWFKANTIYFGIPSYNSTSFSPHRCFVVSGLPLEIRTIYSSDIPFTYYGDQVNSAISLVTKFVVSRNKNHINLVGIQGGNYLKFFDISIYDIEQNYVQSFPLYFHFSNVITGNGGSARGKVCPFSNIPFSVPNLYIAPSRAVNPNVYIKQLFQGRVFSSFSYSPNSKSVSYMQVPLRPDPQRTVDIPQSVVFIGHWHPDAGYFGVHTTPVLTFPDQREVIQVVDKSNTLVVGDYLYINDQNGNRLKYVVANFYTANLYQDTNTTNTSNYRVLIAVRIE